MAIRIRRDRRRRASWSLLRRRRAAPDDLRQRKLAVILAAIAALEHQPAGDGRVTLPGDEPVSAAPTGFAGVMADRVRALVITCRGLPLVIRYHLAHRLRRPTR